MSARTKSTRSTIGVIDIFAGPGGLGEGFSSFMSAAGRHPFKVAVSAEMEASAHATLQLRAFLRSVMRKEGHVPREYHEYLEQVANHEAPPPEERFGRGRWKALWGAAEQEALNLTLGHAAHDAVLYQRIEAVKREYSEMILIGGPPCQAYSLVGRARQRNVKGFRTRGESRHFLYRQYLRILADFKPALFIMENVKGILTSTVGGREMFKAITSDLADPSAALGRPVAASVRTGRYVLLPIHVNEGGRTADAVAEHPGQFVIRCENHGVPQARHRVIVMGVRADLMRPDIAWLPGLQAADSGVSIETALTGLPRLRSGLSRQQDDPDLWREAMERERGRLVKVLRSKMPEISDELDKVVPAYRLPRYSTRYDNRTNAFVEGLRHEQTIVLNHETRGHMESDLGRYMFCAAFADVRRSSPSSEDFPWQLAPDHRNWETGVFADRFRVQLRERPSATVTSHLSKDGHAFIHWDPRQCRSLTVREAARLQTFPDNYLFLGNRTQQYVQVGNAVPPLVAEQIAGVVWQVLDGAAKNGMRGRDPKLSAGGRSRFQERGKVFA